MKGILDNQTLPIKCADCGLETPQSVGWIKTNNQFTCACGRVIEIQADQFLGEIDKAERALAELMNSINKRK